MADMATLTLHPDRLLLPADLADTSTSSTPAKVALSRADGHGRPAAPVRIPHVGEGNHSRVHQAWYIDQAPHDAEVRPFGEGALEQSSAAVLGFLDEDLAADAELVDAVLTHAQDLSGRS